jgi:hypothetical protein
LSTKKRSISSVLKSTFSENEVNRLGRQTGQSERLRKVTPFRLFLAIVEALGMGKVDSLADLLRKFNFQNKTNIAYKAFYNRLARAGFAEFMREMLCRLLTNLALRILKPEAASVLSEFEDIIIQDGSSFALKDALRGVFPGRFTTIEPAAVEIHATYSGFQDDVVSVAIAPDKEAERPFLPAAVELINKLLLADRGYPSVKYFLELCSVGASFIVRLTRSYKPWVLAFYVKGKRHPLRKPVRLAEFLSQNQGQGRAADLDIEFRRGKKRHHFRLVVLPGKEKGMTRLCTNLDRKRFPLQLVGDLYRFRWQVELCFKEWKSYANLHRFDTANEHITDGLIWASLCAAVLKRFLAHAAQLVGGVTMSTQRVAKCVGYVLVDIFAELLRGARARRLVPVMKDCLRYLIDNAPRSNPKRDRDTGRLRAGLAVVGVLSDHL